MTGHLRWCGRALAAIATAAFTAAVFAAWLRPANLSRWLGAWLRGLCL